MTAPEGASQQDIMNYAQSQHQPSQQQPNTASDVGRSFAGGLARGVGQIGDLAEWANPFTAGLAATRTLAPSAKMAPPSPSQTMDEAVRQIAGGYHDPQTTAGKYARTLGEFAPGVVGGPEGLIPKALSVAGPAIGSEFIGENTSGSGMGRFLGAVIGSGGAGLVSRAPSLLASLLKSGKQEVSPTASKAAQYAHDLLYRSGGTTEDLANVSNAAKAKGITTAEAIGPRGVSHLAALANQEGTTGPTLQGALTLRAADMPDRMLSDYASAAGIHPAAAQGDMEDLVAAGRQTVAPMFKQSLSNPSPVWNSDLAELSKRPVIEKAINQAAVNLRNAGKNPNALGLVEQNAATGKFMQQPRPTAEAWDLVKKSVAGQVERDPFGKIIPDSISVNNHNINVANKDLTSVLRDTIPGYGDALDASGDYLSLKSAFDTGQKHILSTTITAKQVADHVARLTPPEIEAYKGGVANKLFNQAQNARLAPSFIKSPAVQEKLTTVLGPDKARQFIDNITTESQLAKTGNFMMPQTGSKTSEILQATEEQHHNPAVKNMVDIGQATAYGVGGYHYGVIRSLARIVARNPSVVNSLGMSQEVRDAAGKLLMMPPDQVAKVLEDMKASGVITPTKASKLAKMLQYSAPLALGSAAYATQQ